MTKRLPSTLCALALLLGIGCDPANQPVDEAPVTPQFDILFGQEIVHSVAITTVDGWSTILTAFLDEGSEEYWQAAVVIDGTNADAAGVRIKGSSPNDKGQAEKKYALKLNFDYYGGERLLGVDKLHLENNKPDPSSLREALASRTYRAMGVPAVRTAFAVVEVDGEDFGNYTMIQDIDKRYLKDAFGTDAHADDGNLYECVPPGCTLEWAGSSIENYRYGSGDDAKGLVLTTNKKDPEKNDYADLINFLNVLNNSSDAEFEAAIQTVFDVDTFLRWLAVAVAIGDFDNYLSWPDNFYLYHRPDSGLFVYIPWDHNKAYGGKKCKGSFEATGAMVDQPTCEMLERPLVDRILAVPAFKNLYLGYLEEMTTKWLTETKQREWIDELDELVGWQIAIDPTNFHTEDEYYQSISESVSIDSPPNLMDYVKRRRAYLVEELNKP
jgi:spore coat protein CotH